MAREIERQRYNMEKLKVYFRNGMIKFEIQVKVGDVVKCWHILLALCVADDF